MSIKYTKETYGIHFRLNIKHDKQKHVYIVIYFIGKSLFIYLRTTKLSYVGVCLTSPSIDSTRKFSNS